jgi:hypothetical protein
LFRRITGDGKEAGPDRLTDKHVARLVKRTALAAGVRGDLSEAERGEKFSGHSLRAGLATSANVESGPIADRLVQQGPLCAEEAVFCCVPPDRVSAAGPVPLLSSVTWEG